jgi:hypothetical protein
VAFHVEIAAGFRHARVFNLSREDLAAEVVQPWLADRRIEMGDREWQPRESKLKILEGPEMSSSDLAFSQGWSNAERASADVTRAVLAAPELAPALPDAFVVETDSPEALTGELVAGQQGRAIEWAEARRRLDDRDPEIAAVVLVVRRPGPDRR